MRERIELLGRLIEKRIRPDGNGTSALELGCGTGPLLPYLECHFKHVAAVDGHASLLTEARRKSQTAILIEADVCRPPLASETCDLILALDVIEHVDPDMLLATARRLIKPEGRLLLSAPAFPDLWSRMDELAGHRCRYRLSTLKTELSRNGWQLVDYTHYQFLLFPALYVSRKLGGGEPASLERLPPAWLDRTFGLINRIEARWLSRLSLPFGSSVIAWAEPI